MNSIRVKLVTAISLAFIGLIILRLVFQDELLLAKATNNLQPAVLVNSNTRPARAPIDITVNEIVASGFTHPVQVIHAGDGSGRLFVVEQDGQIQVISNTTVLGTPFLDINNLVSSPADGGGNSERGLLGLAFHPDYETNGEFYVNYTDNNGHTVIARYLVSADPNVANPFSATTILTVAQPFSNHNGGQLLFSPTDGYLYIGMGDGGSGNDPGNRAQSPNELLGKMLRIDVTGVPTYTVPATNPFTQMAGFRSEIWALGLRNPWRFSFDRATGDMYIGDVGQNAWEEISYQPAGTSGLNFGWRCREGSNLNSLYTNTPPCNNAGFLATLTNPIAEYPNSGSDVAVTGGFIYRGSLYPALIGHYFYADYGSGKIWSIEQTGPNSWTAPALELDTNFTISAFGEDELGELYVVNYNGSIRRLADVNGPSPSLVSSSKSASALSVDPGQPVTYTIRLNNTGPLSNTIAFLSDTVPTGLMYVPNSLTATLGTVDDSLNPVLHWQGSLSIAQNITISYRVTATGAITGGLTNQAHITGSGIVSVTLSNTLFVPKFLSTYLPVLLKS